MILIIGGSFQGKEEFAEAMFSQGEKPRWTDGGNASLEEMLEGKFVRNFHLFAERALRGQAEADLSRLAEQMKEGRPERVVTADETGCGIVPLDPKLRVIREETGRLLCRMARQADQVWRVTCGLGQRIQ